MKQNIKPRLTLLFPILLVLYEIGTYLSNDMYLPALPQMMKDLNLSTTEAQLTLTVWFLGQASMPLLMGIFCERFGRRITLLAGGVIYLLATILCAVAGNEKYLLIGRALEGGMVASMLVAGYASIHDLYVEKEAVKILALMGSISILAPAFGPSLGGIILTLSTWRGIFWFIAIWTAIVITFLYRYMPETITIKTRQPLNFYLLAQNYGRILINRRFMFMLFSMGFIFAGWIAWISAGPLVVIEIFHYSAIMFGVFQAILFAMYILGNYYIKFLLKMIEVKKIIYIGLFITFIGSVLVFLSAYLYPQKFLLFLAAMFVYSFGSALCFPTLNRTIIEASEEPMNARVALFTIFFTVFGAVGSGMASVLFNGKLISLAYLIVGTTFLACVMKIISML